MASNANHDHFRQAVGRGGQERCKAMDIIQLWWKIFPNSIEVKPIISEGDIIYNTTCHKEFSIYLCLITTFSAISKKDVISVNKPISVDKRVGK